MKMYGRSTLLLLVVVMTFGLLMLSSVPAAALPTEPDLKFEYGYEFSGGTPPVGTAPWLEAKFYNDGVNTVTLRLEDANLTDNEFVTGWYFNVNPDIDLSVLSIVQESGGVASTGIAIGEDAYKADGDGFFDILISFPTAGDRFTVDSEAEFTITATGLTAADFDFISAESGIGGLPTAAHVQGIGPDDEDSGWVTTVPEPATLLLLGTGLLGLVGFRRKNFFK